MKIVIDCALCVKEKKIGCQPLTTKKMEDTKKERDRQVEGVLWRAVDLN